MFKTLIWLLMNMKNEFFYLITLNLNLWKCPKFTSTGNTLHSACRSSFTIVSAIWNKYWFTHGNIKTYSKRNVQPYFDATIDHILVHFKGSKGFICTKILLWNFLNSIDTFIFSTGLYVNWTLLFCIALLIHWICKKIWHT